MAEIGLDLNRRVERVGAMPVWRGLSAETAERDSAMGMVLSELGDVAPLLRSLEFVPAAAPAPAAAPGAEPLDPALPPPPPGPPPPRAWVLDFSKVVETLGQEVGTELPEVLRQRILSGLKIGAEEARKVSLEIAGGLDIEAEELERQIEAIALRLEEDEERRAQLKTQAGELQGRAMASHREYMLHRERESDRVEVPGRGGGSDPRARRAGRPLPRPDQPQRDPLPGAQPDAAGSGGDPLRHRPVRRPRHPRRRRPAAARGAARRGDGGRRTGARRHHEQLGGGHPPGAHQRARLWHRAADPRVAGADQAGLRPQLRLRAGADRHRPDRHPAAVAAHDPRAARGDRERRARRPGRPQDPRAGRRQRGDRPARQRLQPHGPRPREATRRSSSRRSACGTTRRSARSCSRSSTSARRPSWRRLAVSSCRCCPASCPSTRPTRWRWRCAPPPRSAATTTTSA